MPVLEFLLRPGAALLMGAVVGLERQWRQRKAGMRTIALVAAGASAFVMCAVMRGQDIEGASLWIPVFASVSWAVRVEGLE